MLLADITTARLVSWYGYISQSSLLFRTTWGLPLSPFYRADSWLMLLLRSRRQKCDFGGSLRNLPPLRSQLIRHGWLQLSSDWENRHYRRERRPWKSARRGWNVRPSASSIHQYAEWPFVLNLNCLQIIFNKTLKWSNFACKKNFCHHLAVKLWWFIIYFCNKTPSFFIILRTRKRAFCPWAPGNWEAWQVFCVFRLKNWGVYTSWIYIQADTEVCKCSVIRAENVLRNHNRQQQQRHWALLGMGIGQRPLDLISWLGQPGFFF